MSPAQGLDPFLTGYGPFNAVSVADMISMVAFGAALIFVLAMPVKGASRDIRTAKWFGVFAMALYLFIGVSNTLQWTNVTSALDPLEDYAKILFFPAIAYIVYAVANAQRLQQTTVSELEVRQQRDLLGSIVETSPTGILVVGADGLVSFANDRARDVLQLKLVDSSGRYEVPETVRMGHELGERRPAGDVLGEFGDRGPAQGVTRFIERPGERTLALEVSAKPLSEAGGSVVAFVDVTDRMRYRRDLERAIDMRTHELLEVNDELRQANRAKQDFLAKMSHELRTPLNSIIGFTGVMLSGAAGPITSEQIRQLKMVRRSGDQLLQLVDDVLDISVIEGGHLEPDTHPFDVCAFLETAVETVQPEALDHGIELEYECKGGDNEVVTDEDKLGQIVRNLLTNAIKFTNSGGVVTVTSDGQPDQVVLTVADTGIGIAPADQERVFEPFQQVDTPDRMRPAGTGLGLAICRDLARLLGGDITVSSELGAGSTFTVTVPRRPASSEAGGG